MKTKYLPFIFLLAACLNISFSAAAQEAEESIWPQEIVGEKTKVVIYQPQPESINGDIVQSRAAISIKLKNDPTPIFGAIWLTSYMDIDKSERKIRLVSVEVTNVRLPEAVDSVKIQRLKTFLEKEMLNSRLEMNYDRFLASIENIEVYQNTGFENKPPKIIFSTKPAILIPIDGEPKYKELEKGYEQLVNTAAFILRKKKKHYLYGGNLWFKTDDLKQGWKHVKNPATNLKILEQKYNPGQEDPMTDKPGELPEIIVSTEPTELIVTGGELKFTPIDGTQLLYVDNTESDLFMDIDLQEYYLLLSGRWFATKKLEGSWSNIKAENISKEFIKIPEESVKGEVLSSVPGSDLAREAVLDASIPQTAAIDRKKATASVTYDGEPKFESIAGTSLRYAVNTASSVFKSGALYFLCDNAVWFSSQSPKGPWVVSDVRPVDVDKIPASNPTYNVRYVYIYESTPTVVYVGYTPGYVGCYVYGPTVVYGTGFYYSGWYGAYYYPRPVTYGFSVRYSPYHGWSMGVSIGFGGPGYWYHGHGYWGPHGYRPPYYRPPYHHRPPGYRPPGYRPHNNRPGQSPGNRPTTRPSTRPATANNLYKNQKDRVRPSTRPSAGANTRPSTRPSGQDGYRPSDRSKNTRPATKPSNSSRPANNVYTDRSGNVYKKSGNDWQSRQNNQWSSPSHQPNRSTNQNLNKSYQNRQRGTQRSQSYNSSRARAGGGRRR